MVVIFILASILYGTAKYYAPPLILFVVEQSLAQKAPAGTDLTKLHERLHAYLSEAPDQDVRMERLLRISQYLEKVQQLTDEELNELLTSNKPETSRLPGVFSLYTGTFCPGKMSERIDTCYRETQA